MKQIRTTIESPYEPNDNGALWLDTSNPDAPILKAFTNGKWQATSGTGTEPVESTANKVTEISSESTDEQYPSAKAVNTAIEKITIPVVDITNLDFRYGYVQIDDDMGRVLRDAIFVKVPFDDGPLILMRDNSAIALSLISNKTKESCIFTYALTVDDPASGPCFGYYLDVCLDHSILSVIRGEI